MKGKEEGLLSYIATQEQPPRQTQTHLPCDNYTAALLPSFIYYLTVYHPDLGCHGCKVINLKSWQMLQSSIPFQNKEMLWLYASGVYGIYCVMTDQEDQMLPMLTGTGYTGFLKRKYLFKHILPGHL